MSDLQELLLDELADVYHAERQLLKGLPRMIKAAKSPRLKQAFESHLDETHGQVRRLEHVFAAFGKPVRGKTCTAMKGLLEEAQAVQKDWKDSNAMDAALIAAAQKVEHYEIASYGCLCTWAKLLGNKVALTLLKQTISEEEAADLKLTSLAVTCSNPEAADTNGSVRIENA